MSKEFPQQLFVYNSGVFCGTLMFDGVTYTFQYLPSYQGQPISLTMPYQLDPYVYTV